MGRTDGVGLGRTGGAGLGRTGGVGLGRTGGVGLGRTGGVACGLDGRSDREPTKVGRGVVASRNGTWEVGVDSAGWHGEASRRPRSGTRARGDRARVQRGAGVGESVERAAGGRSHC